jgi:hypothetical protein
LNKALFVTGLEGPSVTRHVLRAEKKEVITLLPGENLKGHLPVPFHKNMSEFILKDWIIFFSDVWFS